MSGLRFHSTTWRALCGAAIITVAVAPASAQTRSSRDAATAYGARLDAKGIPANQNKNRINNRLESRINNRLSLRIERYQAEQTTDPTAAFGVKSDDKSRAAPVATTPEPQKTP